MGKDNKETGIGFLGLGTMGEPMARRLLDAGTPLTVWNRTEALSVALAKVGAAVAESVQDLFTRCGTVILMLADEASTDAVLARGTPRFATRVTTRRVVAMGTVSPWYSAALGDDIRAAGGRYVEAPVSGSQRQAQEGRLVAMLAGDPDDVAAVKPLLAPMCREAFACGAVPGALRMKLAVNTFLITMVTGLAEAAHFAKRHSLDLACFERILEAGPMSSEVSRIKLAKLVREDFCRQAAISDVLKNSRLVVEAAADAGLASPLMDACLSLYEETESLGFGQDDMISVARALDVRAGPAGTRT
jgi:3-hydroxyisobutyrate dehydrogenase